MALPNKCQNHLLIVLIGIFSADQISQGLYINNIGRNTSIWVLTSFVFLTSFRFMSSFAFLNFFVGLTSLDFELFWCLMLFVLFCCLTSLVLCTLSKKCVRLLTFFYRNFFVPFYFCFQVHSVFMFCVFMELFQILLWHHFRTLILIGRTPWRGGGG